MTKDLNQAYGERLPALPASLSARGVALRRETEADVPFLRHLYVSVRWEELAQTGWPDEGKVAFLADQFALQCQHYATHYHDAVFALVLQDGRPIGRLYLFRGHHDLRIVDVSLLPECRGGGIGALLLEAIFAEARAESKTVSIHVEKFNPAQRLYHRLGFREISESGPYRLMEWRPDASTTTPVEVSCPPS